MSGRVKDSITASSAPHPVRPRKLPPLGLTQVEAEEKAARETIIVADAATGAAAVADKMRAEAGAKRLTKNEKKDAVGDWMFGEGGIRALAAAKPDDHIQEVETKDVMVKRGNHMSAPMKYDRRADPHARKVGMLMEKYTAETAKARSNAELALSRLPPDMVQAVIRRANSPEWILAKAWRHVMRGWRVVARVCNGCVHGGEEDQQAIADSLPMGFSGVVGRLAKRIGATQAHLKRFRAVFRLIDYTNLGGIALTELFKYIGEAPTPLLDRLYFLLVESQLGPQAAGKVLTLETFIGFVLVYCMMNEKELMRFTFDCFDLDNSQTLDEDELCQMVALLNSDSPEYPGNIAAMMAEFDTDKNGYVDFQEFTVLVKKWFLAFYPIFRIHLKLQSMTLGEDQFIVLHRYVAHLRRKSGDGGAVETDSPRREDTEQGGAECDEGDPSLDQDPVPHEDLGDTTGTTRPPSAAPKTPPMKPATTLTGTLSPKRTRAVVPVVANTDSPRPAAPVSPPPYRNSPTSYKSPSTVVTRAAARPGSGGANRNSPGGRIVVPKNGKVAYQGPEPPSVKAASRQRQRPKPHVATSPKGGVTFSEASASLAMSRQARVVSKS